MVNKLIKHYKILFRILNQSKEIKRIREYKNNSLHIILKAFNKVKYSNFSINEINSFKECETYRQFSLENKNLILSEEIELKGPLHRNMVLPGCVGWEGVGG